MLPRRLLEITYKNVKYNTWTLLTIPMGLLFEIMKYVEDHKVLDDFDLCNLNWVYQQRVNNKDV